MEYYRITQKETGGNVITPRFPSASELWAGSRPIFLPGEAKAPADDLIFLPFYESNGFMISEPVKAIWTHYQKGGRYRPCAFGSVVQKRALPYCFMMPRMTDCLHRDTQYHKTGEVRALCLSRRSLGAHRVFGIKTLRRCMLILSEDVLEEMMREKITGFLWEKVDVKE